MEEGMCHTCSPQRYVDLKARVAELEEEKAEAENNLKFYKNTTTYKSKVEVVRANDKLRKETKSLQSKLDKAVEIINRNVSLLDRHGVSSGEFHELMFDSISFRNSIKPEEKE
jgi:predicted phage-related endonuclease